MSYKLILVTLLFLTFNSSFASSECQISTQTFNQWEQNPQQEPTISGGENCHFYKLAWQNFLGLVVPSANKPYQFLNIGEANLAFPLIGNAPNYPDQSIATEQHLSEVTENLQAAAVVPIIDENHRWVRYSVHLNQSQWDAIKTQKLFIAGKFNQLGGSFFDANGPAKSDEAAAKLPKLPDDSMELKLSWRVIETCDLPDSPSPCTPESTDDFIHITTTLNPYSYGDHSYRVDNVTLGLIGMHIVRKSPQFPDWVWMTFEHRKNAPACGESNNEEKWLFHSNDIDAEPNNMFCLPCPVELSKWQTQPADPSLAYNAESNPYLKDVAIQLANETPAKAILDKAQKKLLCTSSPDHFKLAQPALYSSKSCNAIPPKTQICRIQDTDATQLKERESVEQLNQSVWSAISASKKLSVLSNYQLIGSMWYSQNCREGIQSNGELSCQQLGVKRLINSTMETFEQHVNCTICHGPNQFNPMPFLNKPYAQGLLDRSFIFQNIKQFHNQ